MEELIENLIGDVISTSEFLGSAGEMKERKAVSILFGNSIRSLSPEEVDKLKAQGNSAANWDRLRVKEGFKTDFIIRNTFIGECVLGVFDGGEKNVGNGVFLPSGIYNSTIIDSEIGSNALIYNAGLISNYVIKDHAIIYDTGALLAASKCTFGNGIEIAVGIETGGREILSYAELTIPVACEIAVRRQDTVLQQEYREIVESYVNRCTLSFGVVKESSIVRFTNKIEDTWVGENVIIDGATIVKNCTLFGSEEEPTVISHGAYVRNSCVQWGCEVTSMAIVEDSVLTEHSAVEKHGKVIQSIVGPNTSIAEGEVNASLVGPFVGFHHQALLIASLWPDGKGNVGYGANVGSNHTSKAPDQELIIGEGIFFGLGINVKYPSDFTEAPYSIIATAVDLLPQKVDFPFCLINTPSKSISQVSPSYNEIFPGWVLLNNIYTIRRNESKYKKRNKARRSSFEFEVFRLDIVKKLVDARKRLSDVKIKELYTDEDIQGLGKNYMLEHSRKKGIEAYTFYLHYYALNGLKNRVSLLLKNGKNKALSKIYIEETGDPEWEYQRKLLQDEGLSKNSISANLGKLVKMQRDIAQNTQLSKQRDDERGVRILGELYMAHTPAEKDSFVRETWEQTERMNQEIKKLVEALKNISDKS